MMARLSRGMARSRWRAHRAQTGAVTLLAMLILLVLVVIGVGFINSLLGEIQGGIGSRHAVSAFAVAEAGLNWAAGRLGESTAEVYTGETDQIVRGPGAGGPQVGVFDVEVWCVDGVTSPAVNGCVGITPNRRVVRAVGYAPSKAVVAGRRTLQAELAQNTFFTKAICGYEGVNFDQGVVVEGDVGSESTISLQGPPFNPSRIQPAGAGVTPPQPGSAYAVGAITCSVNCNTQVAGTVNPNQPVGSVCPDRARVRTTFVCTPGTSNVTIPTNGSLTIDVNNATSFGDISAGRNATITFDTTGAPGGILNVQVRSIVTGRDALFRVQGGGRVRLHIEEQLWLGQGSRFGIDATTNNPVTADRMTVRSCSDDNPGPAIHFDQTGQVSGLFIVPDGTMDMDQAQLTDGAVLAREVQFDQGTDFDFDGSAINIGFGFNLLRTWQDLP